MLYVGTSGFSFREWVGPFYPPRTSGSKYLAYYASRLRTVEINHTFRRFPTARLLSSWAAQTPPSFKFSVKMHQSITHVARLKDVRGAVADFSGLLETLGTRLGVILFQLPPSLQIDLRRLEKVLAELPPGRKFAFEFRHSSWLVRETAVLLRSAGVAFCRGEIKTGEDLLSPTAPHAYMRLRQIPPFSAAELTAIRLQIQEILTQADELYFYVKHDPNGLSPGTAQDLQSGFAH